MAQIRDFIEISLTWPGLFSHFNIKPHLARATAVSARSNVIVVDRPELSSAYHGESEKKLREVFERARNDSPCIVVLDEVDAMPPKRVDGGEGGGESLQRF
jgi:AAA family ATPase